MVKQNLLALLSVVFLKVRLIILSSFTIQLNLRLRPPLVRDHLSSATSFPKFPKFPRQITIFVTFCNRLPLEATAITFRAKSLTFSFALSGHLTDDRVDTG